MMKHSLHLIDLKPFCGLRDFAKSKSDSGLIAKITLLKAISGPKQIKELLRDFDCGWFAVVFQRIVLGVNPYKTSP